MLNASTWNHGMFIFNTPIHLQNIYVSLLYQGHWVKASVTGPRKVCLCPVHGSFVSDAKAVLWWMWSKLFQTEYNWTFRLKCCSCVFSCWTIVWNSVQNSACSAEISTKVMRGATFYVHPIVTELWPRCIRISMVQHVLKNHRVLRTYIPPIHTYVCMLCTWIWLYIR